MIDSPEILRVIETAPLFHGVPHELLKSLLRNAKLVTLKQGEKILSPGIINEHVYIVISGQLNVQVTPSFSTEPIAVLTPGECVGEMSVLVDGMVSAYVIATTGCELFAIDYTSFWALIDGSNEAARNMLNILARRIRLGNEVMADSFLSHKNFPDNDIIDSLTGLHNYKGIHRKFDRLLPRSVAGKHSLCLILLEADEPDAGGDGAGELLGDQSLRTIAQTMLTFLRPDDHAARLHGKKFAVLLTNTSLSDALATAERLRATICQITVILPDGNTLPPVTISAGVSEALPSDTWGTLIARSDIALEHAIRDGRNRVARIQPDSK